MPTGNFRWGTDKDKEEWANLQEDEKEGALLEFDLEVLKYLHNYFKDYALAPEKLIPKTEDLSLLQRELISDNKVGAPKVPKLLCTLKNKSKYIIHYRNLKLYLSLGLKVTKTHRMILFDQSPWLQKYIELNTKLRTNAKNKFERTSSSS